MNIVLWILQMLLALHTVVGAVWKFSHSAEQTMPSLKAIPHGLWLTLSIIELLCGIGFVAAAVNRPAAIFVPIAAVCIAAEMLLFTGLHLSSGNSNHGPIIYWLVVAAICLFIAYGRIVLKPL